MSRLVKENGENEGLGVEEVVSREINLLPRRAFSFHSQTSPPRHLLINEHHSRQQLFNRSNMDESDPGPLRS
jgi:hypothetical protein